MKAKFRMGLLGYKPDQVKKNIQEIKVQHDLTVEKLQTEIHALIKEREEIEEQTRGLKEYCETYKKEKSRIGQSFLEKYMSVMGKIRDTEDEVNELKRKKHEEISEVENSNKKLRNKVKSATMDLKLIIKDFESRWI